MKKTILEVFNLSSKICFNAISIFKCISIVFVLSFIPCRLFSQTFTAKASFTTGINGAYTAAVAVKSTYSIYVPIGYDGTYRTQIIRYDVQNNSWDSPVAGPVGMGSSFGYSFNLNNEVYFGGGVGGSNNYSNKNWKYTPPGTFTPMDNTIASPDGRAYGFSFEINNIGYVGGGFAWNPGISAYTFPDFVSFNPTLPSGSQWSVMPPYPGTGQYLQAAASLNGYGYAGLGNIFSSGIAQNDFWRYDPVANQWNQMANFPGTARESAILLPRCNKLILAGGWNRVLNIYYDDIWEFDPGIGSNGTWTQIGNDSSIIGPTNGRYGATYTTYGDSLYFGFGAGSNGRTNTWNLLTFPAPVGLFTANDTSICEGEQVVFTDYSTETPTHWEWTFAGGTPVTTSSQNSTVSYSTPGSYDVLLIAKNFCSDTLIKPNYITVNPVPTLSVSSTTICTGSIDSLTAAPSITGGTYTWVPGGATSQTITVSPNSTTTYTVTYTLADCPVQATGTVTALPLPDITVNSPTICAGQTAHLVAVGGDTYIWSTGTVVTGINTADATPVSTSTYTVSGFSAECSDTTISTVTLIPAPIITVNSSTTCAGQTVHLSANGGTTYTWSAGTTVTGINTADVTPISSNTYTVTGSAAGCTDSAVSTVTIIPTPVIAVNSPTICAGQTAHLIANGATTYTWSTGTAGTGINTADAAPTYTTTYTVTGYTAGCVDSSVSTITVNPLPTADFITASLGCSVAFANLTTGAVSYLWDFGNGDTIAEQNPVYVYTTPGVYPVLLTATSSEGCTDTISKVPEPDDLVVFVPNTFTPNADGNNDVFRIESEGLSEFETTIFNRWGEKIYTWNNPEDAWDGTYKGKLVNDGIYICLITASHHCGGKPYQYRGTLLVLK